MDRRDFYFRQKVTESELDGAFDGAENADFDQFIDAGLSGVMEGLTLAPASPVSTTETALTLGTAYNNLGQRIRLGADDTVDFSSISVVTPGNCVPAAVFVKFDRSLSDPRTDGNGITVDFQRNESYAIEVVAGAEVADPGAGNYTESFLNTNGAPITGDNTRVFVGDVIVRNPAGNLDASYILDTRKQWAFKFTAGSYSVAVGTAEEADSAVLTIFNSFASALDSADVAHAPTIGTNPPWGGYLTSTTVEEALEGIVDDLIANTGLVTDSGASCVGYNAANVPAAFASLATATNVQEGFDNMSTELAGSGGASIVGFTGGGIPAGWVTTSAATEVQSALDGIVTDLGTAISGANNGALLVGWMPSLPAVDLGGVTDVALALTALDVNKASIAQPQSWSFAQTFNEIVTINDELDVNAGADPVNIDSNVGISLDAGSASNFTVDGANLVLSTTTSGNVQVLSAGVVQVQAASTLDLDATTSIDVDTSALTVDASGGATYTTTSSNTLIQTLISGDLGIESSGALSVKTKDASSGSISTVDISGGDFTANTISTSGGFVDIRGGSHTAGGTVANQSGGSVRLFGGDTDSSGSGTGGNIVLYPGEDTGGGGADGEIEFRRRINDGTAATNPAMQFGTGTANISLSNPTVTTINFPSAFSSAPRVVNVTFYENPEGPYHVTNITTTSFDISLNAAAAAGTRDFGYIALL